MPVRPIHSSSPPPDVVRGGAVAHAALRWVLLLTMANASFNILATAMGAWTPYRFFLFDLAERFDDYFKFILSYPLPARVEPGFLFGDRVAAALAADSFGGLAALDAGRGTHLFVPPLTTLFCLASAAAMRVFDPGLLFVATIASLALYWCCLARRIRGEGGTAVWIGLGLISYPMLMMVTRGNVYAGVTALLVIDAMLLVVARRAPARSALLLAAAVNIRPNAILFALPLLVLQRDRSRTLSALALGGAGLFTASLAVAHAFYPDYSLASFVRALGRYYALYVVGNDGLAFGSSLYGALKFVLGYQLWADKAALIVSLSILGAAVWLHRARDMAASSWMFLTAAAYALGSTVFTDYHLLAFLLPPAVIAVGRGEWTSNERTVLLTSALMLAPKNYFFFDGIGLQVLINPMILLCGAVAVLAGETWDRVGRAGGRATISTVPA